MLMTLSFLSLEKKGKNFIKKCKNFSEKWPVGSGHSQQATHPCSRRGRRFDDDDDNYDGDDDDGYKDDDDDNDQATLSNKCTMYMYA